MRNANNFMARKKKYGEPVGKKPNKHRINPAPKTFKFYLGDFIDKPPMSADLAYRVIQRQAIKHYGLTSKYDGKGNLR